MVERASVHLRLRADHEAFVVAAHSVFCWDHSLTCGRSSMLSGLASDVLLLNDRYCWSMIYSRQFSSLVEGMWDSGSGQLRLTIRRVIHLGVGACSDLSSVSCKLDFSCY